MSWDPGDPVALREVWLGRIWAARPAILVEDLPEQQTFFVPANNTWKCAADVDGNWLRLPPEDGAPWVLGDRLSSRKSALSFAWPDTAYAVIAYFDAKNGGFLRWYVNLQTPLRRISAGFEYTDHVLDLIVEPDLERWSWKDEEELAEAVARGLFTQELAAGFHEAGERALARLQRREPPFDRDWSTWRPDPAWQKPSLPKGWDASDSGS
jgi:protein associated with RNAse G/E